MTEVWQLGAQEIAELIRTGATSSREVVEAHLARIDAVNPAVNAIVRRFDETALADADAADRSIAEGRAIGPLHGVPCTVKENIDMAGTPTTQGLPAFAEAIADTDSPALERLRAAGAIPIGRTNLPDLGLRVHTNSSLHGLTRNPWDPTVTAGGSSGGEAASLATGMSPIGLGNDIGGSLRNPAHCCGVASIKPTIGVVPSATVIPPTDPGLAAQQMHSEGVMARHIADVRLGLEIVAGWSPRDPVSVPATLTDLSPGEPLRIAVMSAPPGGATHPEIAAAVSRAADLLAEAGHQIVEATPPSFEEIADMWAMLLIADILQQRSLIDLVVSSDAAAVLDALIGQYEPPTLASATLLQSERHRIAREWSHFFIEYPALLCPTWALPAFEHEADLGGDSIEEIMRDTLRPVLPGNFLGLPAAVVPCGTAAGLPVGVQVMGERFTDLRCLAIADAIQQREGVHTPIDPVEA